MKIVTVVGTRPEIIKLSRIINKFDKYFDNILIHTGQNFDYELNEIFFKGLSIRKPNYFLNAAQKTPASFIGEVFKKIEPILLDEKPEAFFILGDTNSCLSAIVAKKHKIPIFHLEAGNRSFDERVPEEINRRIVDHISDINLTYSNISRECLVKEGISPERIIVVGSPLCEIHNHYKNKVRSSNILKKINVKKKKFFVFSIHREENVENIENLKKLNIIFKTLLDKYDYDIIVSTHPRTKSNLDKINIIKNKRLKFFKPFGFFDYVKLQINSCCVLSDSGSITEESAILNFPALIFTCLILLSCGSKNKESINESDSETTSNKVKESTSAPKIEVPKIDVEKSTKNASDTKQITDSNQINLLLKQYEEAVKSRVDLIDFPPGDPDVAMRNLDAIDSDLRRISSKLNSMTLTEEQKSLYNSAKRKIVN